jgi:hypothetical protein
MISSRSPRSMVVPDNQLAPEAPSIAMQPSSSRGLHHGYVPMEKMNVAHKVLDDELNSPH